MTARHRDAAAARCKVSRSRALISSPFATEYIRFITRVHWTGTS